MHASAQLEVRPGREGAAHPLDDHVSCIVAPSDAVFQATPQHQLGEEASHPRVSRAIRVHDLFLGDGQDGMLGDHAFVVQEHRTRALGYDHDPLPFPVYLRDTGDVAGDFLQVRSSVAERLGQRFRLAFVAEKNIDVGQDRFERSLESGGDEGS